MQTGRRSKSHHIDAYYSENDKLRKKKRSFAVVGFSVLVVCIVADWPESSGTVPHLSLSHCPATELYTFYCLSRK